MKNRRMLSFLIYMAVLFLVFTWVTNSFGGNRDHLAYSEIVSLFEDGKVKSFIVQGDQIQLELKEARKGRTTLVTHLGDPDAFREDLGELIHRQSEDGTLVSYDFAPVKGFSAMDLMLPLVLSGLVLLLLWFLLMSKANGNNPLATFGKARTVLGVADGRKVTFDDVAGADEEKAELQEVVDFLRAPEKFNQMGARIPHGILLVGPPGTGKTLLARAVAGEAGVQFLSISGSDFVEMYVGVGASRVRDLFDQAKKIAPAIIFIDEIDAVGRKRGSGMGGGHDEKEQTLNQLLVEMDGFGKTEGVIVLAATNRPDILDPALRRPGRFDRQIYVGAPDVKGREDILKVHAKDKHLADDVSFKTIAMATSGFTGADLQNLLNEAAILATRKNRPVIVMEDLEQAMMKVIAGPEKRSRLRNARDMRLTAIHEAGHAVAMYHLPTHDPVHQISIIPRGNALGLTWSMPKEESTHVTRNEMFEDIVGLLGGRVAEDIVFHDVSTGASNDIDRASQLARDMVGRFGMCKELGTVSYTSDDEVFIGGSYGKTRSYSEQVAGMMDEQVKKLIDEAYERCTKILTEDREKLEKIADFLVEYETMSAEQFEDCMEGREIRSEKASLFDAFRQEDAQKDPEISQSGETVSEAVSDDSEQTED